jgi:hypothetical protein
MDPDNTDPGQAQDIPPLHPPPIDSSLEGSPAYAEQAALAGQTASGPVVTDSGPTIQNATPEQSQALSAGAAAANQRLANPTCGNFFGGTQNGQQALNSFTLLVDPSMPKTGHPQGFIDLNDPNTMHVNPYGSSFVTPSGATYTFYLRDGLSYYKLTLSGEQASAFAQFHETGHKTRSFGATDDDAFELPVKWMNNYTNNWKIWNACFSDVKPTAAYNVPRPALK